MNLNDFQHRAGFTDEHQTRVQGPMMLPVYLAGIAKEFGELQDTFYDIQTKNSGVINEVYKERLVMETMDVIWFCVRLLWYLGCTFNTGAVNLLAKLMQRHAEGSLYDRGLRGHEPEKQADAAEQANGTPAHGTNGIHG